MQHEYQSISDSVVKPEGEEMSVNRYEFEDHGSNESDGRYVTYEDYAALEARCEALDAECKSLSRFISGSCYVFDGDHDDDMPDEFVDASHYMPIFTPATDAFLAEVRASAFNDLCAEFVKHKALAGLDDRQKVTVFEATEALLHCAEQLDTQLRKGVQS